MEVENKLTRKQEFFCREYLTDFNATQAAIRAGYSEDTAQQISSENLSKPVIQSRIEQLINERAAALTLTQERILHELQRIAFADPRSVMDWGPDGVKLKPSEDLTEDQSAIVAEASQTTSKDGGSIKIKLNDKQKALELLGRHLGMFNDKIEQTVKNAPGEKFEIDVTPENAAKAFEEISKEI